MSGASKPHQHGHRERLRERAVEGGLPSLPDYELLELFLFRSIPQRDVKALAKGLIERFGSIGAAAAAPAAELTAFPGVGASVALDLNLLHELLQRAARAEFARRPVISSWSALLDYVRTAIQHEPREQVRVLYLDTKNQLIRDEVTSRGTTNHAPLYPREVMRRALELSASSVILVHNHPSGDPSPSRADIDITRAIAAAGKPLGIAVHDHLIIGARGHASLRAQGLL